MKKLLLLLLLSIGPAVLLSMEEKYAGEYASHLQDSWFEDDVIEGSEFLESYQKVTILDAEEWQHVQEQLSELLSKKITDWDMLPQKIKLYIISFLPSKVEKIKTFFDFSLVNHDFAYLISESSFAEIKKYEFPGQKKITINDIFVKAAENGHYSIVKTLIERGVKSIDIYEGNALNIMNPRHWCKDMAKLLIEAGEVEAIDDIDNTPLIRAAANGHTEIILLLIFNCYGPYINNADSHGNTPLIVASKNGHVETAQLIIDCGGNTSNHDNRGDTSLMVAASHGHKEVCQLLLDQNVDVNSTSNDMFTPLISAAQNGHAHIVDLLIEHGATIEAKNIAGYTSLMIAAVNGHTETAKLLIKRGANIEAQTKLGHTALMAAARSGKTKTARLLIDYGADVNNHDDRGITPLMQAARNGHAEIVKLLLAQGADPNIKTSQGATAASMAAKAGYTEIVALLPATHCLIS